MLSILLRPTIYFQFEIEGMSYEENFGLLGYNDASIDLNATPCCSEDFVGQTREIIY